MTTPEAMDVNRVDLSLIESEGLTPMEAVDAIRYALDHHFGPNREPVCLAGHNIGFDVGFLQRLYRLGKADYWQDFSRRTIDTATLFAFFMAAGLVPPGKANGDRMFASMGIPIGQEHTVSQFRRPAEAELVGPSDPLTDHTGVKDRIASRRRSGPKGGHTQEIEKEETRKGLWHRLPRERGALESNAQTGGFGDHRYGIQRMICAPGNPWLCGFRNGMEKIEQRFMPIFVVGGVTVGSKSS